MTKRNIPGYGWMQRSTAVLQAIASTVVTLSDMTSVANWQTILSYQIPKRQIVQLREGPRFGHTIWVELNDVVPAVIAATDKIRIIKADSDGNYISTIWEGVYSDFVTAVSGNKSSREFQVFPHNDARLDEANILQVQCYTATQLVIIANSTIQIVHDKWIPRRE